MDKVTMVKTDATISLKIGTAFIQKLQNIITSTVDEKGKDNIEKFIKEMETMSKDDNFSESWMDCLNIIMTLNREIESELIRSGNTYEEDLTKP